VLKIGDHISMTISNMRFNCKYGKDQGFRSQTRAVWRVSAYICRPCRHVPTHHLLFWFIN